MTQSTNFIFQAYRILKKALGRFDAVVECNELAIREFLSIAENSENPSGYLEQISRKHNIAVNDIELDLWQVRAAHFYILSVYQQFEEFLENFRIEHPASESWDYRKTQKEDHKQETLFMSILRNIGTKDHIENKRIIGAYRIDIYEYYRLVRNRFMHTEIKDKKLYNKLVEIKKDYASLIKEKYKVETAPNDYEKISFDDFILFTRVVKDIVLQLCHIAKPSDKEIAEMIIVMDQMGDDNIKLKNLKKFKNNLDRLNNALLTLLHNLYNLDRKEAQPIVEIIIRVYP